MKTAEPPVTKTPFEVHAVRPGPSLRDIVHCFYWTSIGDDPHSHSRHMARVLPHAAADIIISIDNPIEWDLRGTKGILSGGVLSGPFLTTPTYRWVGKGSIFGIRFRHGALGRMLPFSAKRMVNTVVPLADVWGAQKCQDLLIDPIHKASDFESKVKIAQDAISQCFMSAPAADPRLTAAVKLIMETRGKLGVSELAAKLEISRQTLKSKFDDAIGIAPKLFGRLLRFQQTLKILYGSGRNSWSDLAQECGYYDQAHLIREFNHFTGFSPERLLRDIARGEAYYYFHAAEQTTQLMSDSSKKFASNS